MLSQLCSLGGVRGFVAASTGRFAALLLLVAPALGQVVGKLELGAPNVGAFVLRGTLPVPGGTFPRADGKQPFGVIDANGQTVPAQCQLVSRYAHDPLGADVVEILARVQRPAGAAPGDRITYSIVDFPHTPTVMTPSASTAALLGAPGAVTLRTKDVFGHEYRADLLRGLDGVVTTKSGEAAVQKRYYEAMRPTAGTAGPPNGPLPRMMAVHSYVTQWLGEDLVSLDVRIHNGTSGADQLRDIDDPQDSLYFRYLELWLPGGWTVLTDWRDPAIGQLRQQGTSTVLPLIDPIPTGELHVMHPQAQTQRRFVLVRKGQEVRARSLISEEWLGFCRRGTNGQGAPLWSWWNPATANYFPQRHVIPNLDYLGQSATRAKLKADLAKISARMIDGGSNLGPITAPVLGWAHPWGVKYGGMTSGTEIYCYDGLSTADSASADGYRLSQLSLRMYMERNPTALFNKDGNPTQYSEWITHGPQFDYIYMQFYLQLLSGHDPFGFDQAERYQVDYVNANGLEPDYDHDLSLYKPIDLQHQIRITRSMKVLTWLGNDSLAKDDLRMHAELVRLSYHDLHCSPGGNVMGTGMLADLNEVQNTPGVGVNIGRYEGWSFDAMAAAYSINPPAWRQAAKGWFDNVVTIVRDGQSTCSGTLQRTLSPKMLNGQYHVRQSIEQAILENGMWGILSSVYRGTPSGLGTQLRDVIKKSTYSMVNFPAWDTAKKGPWAQLAVSPQLDTRPPFCTFIPPNGTSSGVDKFQAWSSFAYGYELTNDPLFLAKGLQMAGGFDLLNSLENSNYQNIENRAALIALLQNLP